MEQFKHLGTTLTNKNYIQEEIKQIEFGECLLLFGAEHFIFQCPIQKVKDQDI
jgi:hypothetical protein